MLYSRFHFLILYFMLWRHSRGGQLLYNARQLAIALERTPQR